MSKKKPSSGTTKGTRTRLHEEQRTLYHVKLLRAAEVTFRHKSYSGTSIDDIAKAADVSRATFYRHFHSKIEILSAMTTRLATVFHSAHDLACDAENVDEAVIAKWIEANIALVRANAPLVQTVREAAATEPILFGEHIIALHNLAIQKLGRTLPAFQVASRGDAGGARIKAHVLLRQLDMFCYDVGVGGWVEGYEVGCGMLARQFMEFIREFPVRAETAHPC